MTNLVSRALVRHVSAIEAVIEQPLPSMATDPASRRDAPNSDPPVVAALTCDAAASSSHRTSPILEWCTFSSA